MPPRRLPQDRARHAAFRALLQLGSGGELRIDQVIERQQPEDLRDRGLMREIVLGVMRHSQLYDHLAGAFLDRRGPPPPALRISGATACAAKN